MIIVRHLVVALEMLDSLIVTRISLLRTETRKFDSVSLRRRA